MAEQISLHRFSGKLDNSVGFRGRKNSAFERYYRGPAKGRLLPLSMKKQIARMTVLGELSNILYPVYSLGMGKFAKRRQMAVNNLFVKKNAPAVAVSDSLETTITYSNISVAEGHLPAVLFGQAKFSAPQTVEVTFSSAEGIVGASGKDDVFVAVFCPTDNGIILSTPVKRTVGEVRVSIPDAWNGLKVEVWGFAVGGEATNRNFGESSPSAFLGEGTIN